MQLVPTGVPREPLWSPSAEVKEVSNMAKFLEAVNKRFVKTFATYQELYQWSIDHPEEFWGMVWDFVGIEASVPFDSVIENPHLWPGTRWFTKARLNFAENLLRHRQSSSIAMIFRGENGTKREYSYKELYAAVMKTANALKGMGVKKGNRVVGYMANTPESAIAMLATFTLGAVWASCATDTGVKAAIDRLGQVEPKVMFVTGGYYYKGKPINCREKAAKIAEGIPTLEKVVVCGYDGVSPLDKIPHAITYEDFLKTGEHGWMELQFEQIGSNDPALIMFTSGTTGKPKCMVQSTGVMLNHLKELIIHSDLKKDDTLFYITSCSWMMWNWMISGLATGCKIIFFDGNPSHPGNSAMWDLVQEERVTIFGLSATYLEILMREGYIPKDHHDLSALRQISQTGSALSEEGFRWVYKNIKRDLFFNSISGGTDINGCFALGSLFQPVYAGEIAGPALGMAVDVFDENGEPAKDDVPGELVCKAPAPSMPIFFWKDDGNQRYHSAYFRLFHSSRVWAHGDTILRHSDTGGFTFLGRSDAVLMPSGGRTAPAEYYDIVAQFPEIVDCLVAGRRIPGDEKVILFVQMAKGQKLTDDLQTRIRKALRIDAAPRYVPALIISCPDIPYTRSGKKSEVPVKNILNGIPVTNRDAMRNPESLDFYVDILPTILEGLGLA